MSALTMPEPRPPMAAPENDPSDGGASSRSGYSFDASSRAPSTWDEDDLITEITEEVLDMCTDGKSWRVQFHRHMTFRSARFRLWTLDGLLLAPIDLSGLESLDVSNNRLKELDCIAGTSATLKKEGCVQGQLRFQSLRVLKARRNQLEAFEAAMPTLKELDLGHNRLKKLPAMAGLSNLEVLVFSHNQMSGSWDSLVRLQKLKKLDLSDNCFDFKPTEFGEQLEMIKCLHHLVSLRLKDNLFAKTTAQGGCFPEYQTYTLQQMKHQLTTLDDIVEKEDFLEAVENSSSMGDLNLQDYDIMVWQRQKLVGDRKDKGDHKNQRGDIDVPVWRDLADALIEGVEDASMIPKTVKHVVRFSNQVAKVSADNSGSNKVKTELWKSHTHGKSVNLEAKEIDCQIESFLQNFKVVMGRLETDTSRRLMLLRSLAKLTAVPEHREIGNEAGNTGLGFKCMQLLGFLMKRSAEAELEVLGVVREIIIEPLSAKQKVQELPLTTMIALSTFESGRLAEFLRPIVSWLVDMYKKAGSTKEIVHMLAVATGDRRNARESVDLSSGSRDLPCQVVKELDDRSIATSSMKRDLYIGHLKILRNTALVSTHAVEHYKEKKVHRELLKNLFLVFTKDDVGMELGQLLRKKFGGDKVAEGLQDLRTCSAILDAASALMQKSPDILLECMEWTSQKQSFIGFLRIAPLAVPVTDPALLAATLGCYDTILQHYPKDKVQGRMRILEEIIKDLAKMGPMLELMDYNSTKFRELFQAAETHVASLNTDTDKKSAPAGRNLSQQAPRFCNVRNPLVHRCLASVVALVEFFTAEGKTDRLCDEVSDEMNQKERETLLFKLLEIPSAEVQNAVMKCVRHVGADDMSEEDTAYLIKLLDNDKNIASEGPIFEKVILQMDLLANAQGGLLKKLAERCIFAIVRVMHVNAHRNTYGAETVEREKHALSQTCVQFLQTASRDKDLRHPHLRTKYVNRSVVEILKKEDELNGPEDPDIDVECTWTGRSIETLLTCLSGHERLQAQGKVAFRVIARIANILEGWSDMPQQLEKKEETKVCRAAVELIGEKESAMWKYEQQLRAQLARLDDIERDDRFSQQLVFSNYEGADRLVSFLNGLFEEGEQRTATMVQETSTMKASRDLMDSTVHKAQKYWKEKLETIQANAQQQQQLQQRQQQQQLTGKEDSSGDEAGEEYQEGVEAPCIEFEGSEFSGLPNEPEVDLRKKPTFFQGTLGGAMSISLMARWDAFNKWSTVLDFGSGKPQDNVMISNQGATNNLVFEIFDGKESSRRLTVPALIQLGETHRYLFTVSAAGQMRIWCDGKIVGEKSNGRAPKFNRRRELYIGTSHWEPWEHAPFQGSITDVKVWQGSVVDWGAVDPDSSEKAEEQPDRQLLMKVFMELPPRERLEKPMLQGVIGGSTSVSPELLIQEQLYEDINTGRVGVAYLVAAMLRCCYAVLKFPAAEKMRKEMVKRLHDPLKVGRLLSLTALCRPFDCNVAGKLLRVLTAALELGPSETDVPLDRLVLFDQVACSIPEICRITVSALQQQDNPELHMRGKVLSTEIVGFACAISRTVPFCDISGFNNVKELKLKFAELCFERLLPLTLVKAIIRMLSSFSTPDDEQDPTSAEEETKLWEASRTVLAQLLEFCPKMKYTILEVFSTVQVSGTAVLRPSFLSSLLLKSQQNVAQSKMDTFLNEQAATVGRWQANLTSQRWHDSGPKRALMSAKVQVVVNKKPLRVSSLKHAECCFICLVTNQAVHIIDATAPGYPDNPLIVEVRYFSDMTRLVRGCTEQVLTIGWGVVKDYDDEGQPNLHEEFMTLICHCEADRNELLSKLHALSEPPDGKPKHRVPIQSDVTFSKALETQVSEGGNVLLLNTFVFSDGNLCMFSLDEKSLFECIVNFEHWSPPSDDDQDALADEKDDEGGGRPADGGPPGGANAGGGEEAAGSAAEEVARLRKRARGTFDEHHDKQELDQLVQPTSWPLKELSKVTFYPDKRPRVGLAFNSEVRTMHFLDDMSRETWRKTLLAQLTKIEEGATWSRHYEGSSAVVPAG